MEYRKYRAKTFQEAKLKMLLDVGNRAYIVSQKKVKDGGIFGLFGTTMVELTAGVMENDPLSKKQESRGRSETLDSRLDPDLNNSSRRTYSDRPHNNNMERFIENNENLAREADNQQDNKLRNELDALKSLVARIMADKEKGGHRQAPSQPESHTQNHGLSQPQTSTQYQDQYENTYHKPITESQHNNMFYRSEPRPVHLEQNEIEKGKELIKMFLKEEDFNDEFIDSLCSLSSVQMILAKEKSLGRLKACIKQQISEIIETSNGINLKDNETNVICLVGPTGVGKTTSLAKLGAYFGVFQKKKVKFISIDTYRVGAIQQLKLYADIMEIPFAKVNNVEELKMELYNREYDLILVDTTGRSQKNLDDIRDIKKYLDIVQGNNHISLVVSATTKYKDLVEILDKFDILKYTDIIITKLDETNSLGPLISAISPKKRQLSYVTFGQSVPEDIEEASREKIIDMVLKV
ncbi:MAG: hypothetical protein OEZ36_14685 [Spirochaetota bacterium]|nr:hypothetical protein [Spirochaetota bacterium]